MPLLAAMLPRENMGAGASVPGGAGASDLAGDGSLSPPPPLVTPQPSPRTEESGNARLVRQRMPTPSPVRQPSPKVVHSSETNPSPFMEDNIAGGDFYVSPNQSYEVPPTTGQPASGAEEPNALTILSSKLDRCMDQIGALETELK
ncbi:hypothetical protein Tco_0239016, partial [Tanacetum coccineum]